MSPVIILSVAFGYLLLLFGVAYYADKRAAAGKSLIDNPWVYALSLAVYCTAWTFYGSVGRASETGLGFLPIYIGPTLMIAIWYVLLRKIIRISKAERITSIADFIGSRYGKSTFLAGMVTVIAVFGIIPYISLQLKAISTSYQVIANYGADSTDYLSTTIFLDTAFYVTLVLAVFTILFGTRQLDASEKHEGMVAAIAFESIIKLFAFIFAGLFVVFVLYSSPFELFREAYSREETKNLLVLAGDQVLYNDWIWLTILSMPAILLLPRQFQTAVVENVRIDHVRSAVWMFPLYLLIINLFVLPIALAGLMHPSLSGMDADTFVLTLPLAEGRQTLALLVFVGGLSAATSMVIVASIALSTMISNDLVMPAFLRYDAFGLLKKKAAGPFILNIRRISIVLILLLAYLYFKYLGENYTLVSIGLVSFAAVAQFAPAFIGGLYWSGATRAGALAGILCGTIIWFYTLVIPSVAGLSPVIEQFVSNGPYGLDWLKPNALFGLEGYSPVAQSVFWSLTLNGIFFVGCSLFTKQNALEVTQAALFVYGKSLDKNKGPRQQQVVKVLTLKAVLRRFMGNGRMIQLVEDYEATRANLPGDSQKAPQEFIQYVENQLAGAIGSASARLLMSTEVRETPLTVNEVRNILDETRQVLEFSRALQEKSNKLQLATDELRKANEQLKQLDQMKDEFVATVTHELKTPLTSIRALTEIMLDMPDISTQKRDEFLTIIQRETERLTRLINQLLDTQKANTGNLEMDVKLVNLAELIVKAVESMKQVFVDASVELSLDLDEHVPDVMVDEDRITQVLLNLLSNAAKFCNEEIGQVFVKLGMDDGHVYVAVTDNGSGIAASDMDKLFQPFVQVGQMYNRKPGTGLGLSISKKIMEAHNGSLTVVSAPGQGSTFTMALEI